MRRIVLPVVFALGCGSSTQVPTPTVTTKSGTPPVEARFLDVTVEGTELEVGECEQLTIVMAQGFGVALGQVLNRGDSMVVVGKQKIRINGQSPAAGGDVSKMRSGTAVVARVRPFDCMDLRAAADSMVVRGDSVPELTWAKGTMHAHLDVRSDLSPSAYTGRLSGRGAVAEHVHQSSWEIIALVDALGTFVIDGREERVGPRAVLVIPPNTKHAWRPDPDSSMDAVQFYAPPGPEMRFQVLADQERSDPRTTK